MAGLEQQAAKDLVASKENAASGKGDSGRGTRGDIDEMDDEESYYKWVVALKLSLSFLCCWLYQCRVLKMMLVV